MTKRIIHVLLLLTLLLTTVSTAAASAADPAAKLDDYLRAKLAQQPGARVSVLIHRKPQTGLLSIVTSLGGTVLGTLRLANILIAEVPASGLLTIASDRNVTRISYDAPVRVQAAPTIVTGSTLRTAYPQVVRAAELWDDGVPVQGTGIGVAVLDSGIDLHGDLRGPGLNGQPGSSRVVARVAMGVGTGVADENGHGTLVAGVLGGRGWGATGTADDARYVGVAPNVNIVGVKVADMSGSARVSHVISGIEWVVANKAVHNIRAINLSVLSTVSESYKTSPLDAAVELAWKSGIVVVVAAGNLGPNTMLYPPANSPFAITVGAMDDNGTAATTDDSLATYSSYGTTQDGFVKPDIVAPGRKIVGPLSGTGDRLAQLYPERVTDAQYIRMSGTSFAAPVVAGVVAQILQKRPTLKPDNVKWLLTRTAKPVGAPGTGAGYVQSAAAVAFGGTVGKANVGVKPGGMAGMACVTTTSCLNSVVNLLLRLTVGLLINTLQSTGAAWEGAAWEGAAWEGAAWEGAAWEGAAWEGAAWEGAAWEGAAWEGAAWEGAAWENAAGD